MSQVRPVLTRLVHFEDALQKTGWGLYYKFLVGFSAFNLLTNGFVLLCMHLALPLSSCDNVIKTNEMVDIFICFVIGKAVGGFLLCSISDNTGKKCMISKSLIIVFASCFVTAFSHNSYTVYLAAFILGSGLQANSGCMKIYLAEILPSESRGFYLLLPDLFWTVGYFSTAIFIYYFGTSDSNTSEHQGMDMRLTAWRIIFAVGGGLCLTMGCSSALLEMSPRYMLFKKRIITASIILKQFYAINKSKYSETFEVHSQQLVDLISDYGINLEPEPAGLFSQTITTGKVIVRMLKLLLRRPFLKVVVIASLLKIPILMGVVGCNVFLARLLENQNASIAGPNFIHFTIIRQYDTTQGFQQIQFGNFLLISLNVAFGQILLLCTIDRFGRRFPIFAGLTICSLTSVLMGYCSNFTLLAMSSSLFTIGYVFVEATVGVVVIEAFPTAIRGTALGATNFYSSLLSCFLYKFLDLSHRYFLSIFAAATFGMSVLACFMPELKGRPMVE